VNVQFAPQAEADLTDALAYVRERNPHAAEKLAARIFGIIEMLAHGDFRGQDQRLTTGELVSSWPVPPFRIYYRITGDVLQVLRVYHRARRPIAR
jgi:plasmid stabilization system protein ParE